MIEGIALGLISWLSIIFTWFHLPVWTRKQTIKHPLLTDLATSGLAFLLLSGISKSLVAVIGAVFTGLLINMTLIIMARSNYEPT